MKRASNGNEYIYIYIVENLTNSLHQYEEIYGMLGNNFPLLELEANKRNQRSL